MSYESPNELDQRLAQRLCKYFPVQNSLDLLTDLTTYEKKQQNNFVSEHLRLHFNNRGNS